MIKVGIIGVENFYCAVIFKFCNVERSVLVWVVVVWGEIVKFVEVVAKIG